MNPIRYEGEACMYTTILTRCVEDKFKESVLLRLSCLGFCGLRCCCCFFSSSAFSRCRCLRRSGLIEFFWFIVSLHISDSVTSGIKSSCGPSSHPRPHCLRIVSISSPLDMIGLTARKVITPMITTVQEMSASLSRPFAPPPLLRPPPPTSPVCLRFHQCHGDIAKNTLTKPSSPRDAKPFKKCSSHEVSSSSSSKAVPPVGNDVIVSYGSRYREMIGSATKPKTKTVVSIIKKVIAICVRVLVISRLHRILSKRYWYLHVGHSQKFRRL